MNPDPNHAEPDSSLLRLFVEQRDEEAFRRLVEKYTPLVYGVALRRMADSHLAEEITQNVFIALARKAASLNGQRALGAWLHRAATLESLKAARATITRERHLDMIRQQSEIDAQAQDSLWREIRPHLDEMLLKLPAKDREVLVRHYFEGLTFKQIAEELGLTAETAQKRSSRALAKLAHSLGRRGVAVSAGVLGGKLAFELTPSVPSGLVLKSTASALAATSSITAGTSSSFLTIVTAMSVSKPAFAAAFVLAASVPLGFHLRETDASAPEPVSIREVPFGESVLARRPIAAEPETFDADAFRRSIQRLLADSPDNGARTRRLQRLLFTLEESAVQEAISVLDEFDDPGSHVLDLVAAAFARWAELDPASAVAGAIRRPVGRWGYYPLNGAWQTWAFLDWESARAWARETPSEYDYSFLFWGVLDDQAALDCLQSIAWAEQLAQDYPDRAEAFHERALSAWAKSQPDEAISWMDEHLTDPVARDRLIGQALQRLGERDPATALDSMALVDNPERVREVRYNLFWQWALIQPDLASRYLKEALASGQQWDDHTLRSAAEALARNAPERALEVARSIQDPNQKDLMYGGILNGGQFSDHTLLIEAADAIGEQAARTNNSLGSFLTAWAKHDREAAAAWVDALPQGGKKEWAQHVFPSK